MTKDEIGNLVGHFTWSFGCQFFIETDETNFTWNDPDYRGDGKLSIFNGSYSDWCTKIGIPYGRDKGRHLIKEYCKDFTLSGAVISRRQL